MKFINKNKRKLINLEKEREDFYCGENLEDQSQVSKKPKNLEDFEAECQKCMILCNESLGQNTFSLNTELDLWND